MQRGSNDHPNGLHRQWLPRTLDFRTLTQADFDTTAGYADVNGLHMYYEVSGAGPPLLAMSGGTQSLEMFSDVDVLARSFTVPSPEQMGHGRTADDTDRALDHHDMAESTYELLVHLVIEKHPHLRVQRWGYPRP